MSLHRGDQRAPRHWRRILRIAVSLGLLTVLFFSMDWPTVLGYAERLTPALSALVIVVFAVQLALSSWKWQWALRIHQLFFPYGFLTRVLVSGFFLNNFLPTSIGGDAYRVYRTLPPEPPKSRAISAVILERVVGFSTLLLLGLAGSVALYSTSRLARAYVMLATGCTAFALVAYVLIRMRPTGWRAPRFLSSPKLAPVLDNLRSIAAARGEWAPLVTLSLLFQAQAVFVLYVLFNSLGAPIGLAQAALIAAAAGVAAVVPFSINGLGIVEATIAGTAVAVGVSYEAGLLVAVLMRILLIPLTLLAGLLYAFEPRHQPLSLNKPEYGNVRSPG